MKTIIKDIKNNHFLIIIISFAVLGIVLLASLGQFAEAYHSRGITPSATASCSSGSTLSVYANWQPNFHDDQYVGLINAQNSDDAWWVRVYGQSDHTFSPVDQSKSYYVLVSTWDSEGEHISNRSNTVQKSCAPTLSVTRARNLQYPTNIVCGDATSVHATFNWTPASITGGTFDEQILDVGLSSSGPWTPNSVPVGSGSTTLVNMPHKSTIYWRINSHVSGENWYPSSVANFVTQDCSPPPPPPAEVIVTPASLLAPIQSDCVNNSITVTFGWNRASASNGSPIIEEWLDLDLVNDAFAPGEFTGVNVKGNNGTYQISLNPDTQVWWRINTWIYDGWYPTSASFRTNSCTPTAPPPAPGGFAVVNLDSSCTDSPYDTTLTWSEVRGASYRVYVSTNNGPKEKSFDGSANIIQMTAQPDSQYSWWVSSYNAAGESAQAQGPDFSRAKCTVAPPPPPPPPPPTSQVTPASNLTAISQSCVDEISVNADFQWTVAQGANFDLQFHDWDIDTTDPWNYVEVPVGTGHVVRTNLPHKTTIYWRVNTRDSATGKWYPSEIKSFETTGCDTPTAPPPPPAPAEPTKPVLGNVTFAQSCNAAGYMDATFFWTRASDAAGNTVTGQWLDLSLDNQNTLGWPDGSYLTAQPSPTDTSYQAKDGQPVIGPLLGGKTHWWRISSQIGGQWAISQTGSFTTPTCQPTQAPPPPPPAQPPVSNLRVFAPPECASNPGDTYSLGLQWDGTSSILWADISTNPDFPTGQFAAKDVSGLSLTGAPGGFSNNLLLKADTPYYWRLWYGQESTWAYPEQRSFSIPKCAAPPLPPEPPIACNDPTAFSLQGPLDFVTFPTPSFSWTASSNHTQYFIDLSTDNFQTWWYVAVSPDQTSFPWPTWSTEFSAGKPAPNAGLEPGTYQWRMSALNPCDPGNPGDDKFVFAGPVTFKYDPQAPTPPPSEIFPAYGLDVDPNPDDDYTKVGTINGLGTVNATFSWLKDPRTSRDPSVTQWIYLTYKEDGPPTRTNSVKIPIDINLASFYLAEPDGMTPDKDHSWRVDTCNNCDTTSFLSNVQSFKTTATPVTQPPTGGGELTTATPQNPNGEISLANFYDLEFLWNTNGVSGVDSYWIDVSPASTGFGWWWACNPGNVNSTTWSKCSFETLKPGGVSGGATFDDNPDHAVPNFLPNGSYQWRVASVLSAGGIKESSPMNFSVNDSPSSQTPPPSASKPSAPQINDISLIDQQCYQDNPSIPFSWSPATGATGYWVDVSLDGSFAQGTFWNVNIPYQVNTGADAQNPFFFWSTSDPLFQDSAGNSHAPENNTGYYWRVYAYNDAGGSHSRTSEFTSKNCASPTPEACLPSGQFALINPPETVDNPSPAFDWQTSSGTVRYFFDFTDNPANGWWYVPVSVTHLSQLPSMYANNYLGNQQAPTSLNPGTQYYWKVTALSDCAAKKLDSGDPTWVDSLTPSNGSFDAWKPLIYYSQTLPPAAQAPDNVPSVQITANDCSSPNQTPNVSFSWGKAARAEVYFLDVSTDNFASWHNVELSADTTTFTWNSQNRLSEDFAPNSTTPYQYRVIAWNKYDFSPQHTYGADFTTSDCTRIIKTGADLAINIRETDVVVAAGGLASYGIDISYPDGWTDLLTLSPNHGQTLPNQPTIHVGYDLGGSSNFGLPRTTVGLGLQTEEATPPGTYEVTIKACKTKDPSFCKEDTATLEVKPLPYNLSSENRSCPVIAFSWDRQADNNLFLKIFNNENMTSQIDSLVITGLDGVSWTKASSSKTYFSGIFYNDELISNRVSASCEAIGGGLEFNIPIRNTAIQVANRSVANHRDGIRFYGSVEAVQKKLDYVIESAISHGWNPAFIATIWTEESGSTTNIGYLKSGCMGSIEDNLGCFYNDPNFQRITDWSTFAAWHCGPNQKVICQNNPNYLRNVRSIYNLYVSPENRVDSYIRKLADFFIVIKEKLI